VGNWGKMKKSIDIATMLFALWTIVSGVVDSDIHVVISSIFAILIFIHAFLYKKMLFTYFKELRWRWSLVVLGILTIIITSIID
jgi:hypothetical protein